MLVDDVLYDFLTIGRVSVALHDLNLAILACRCRIAVAYPRRCKERVVGKGAGFDQVRFTPAGDASMKRRKSPEGLSPMSENDQYPAEAHGTKLPVALLAVAVITVAVGVFVFARPDGAADPTITGGIPPVADHAASQQPAAPPPVSP